MIDVSTYNKIKEAIRKPWLSVFMDGRNEYGTHLIPMSPDNLCLTEEGYEELLDSRGNDVEQIFKDAEKLGYKEGCVIVVECRIVKYNDENHYYELIQVNDELTQLIFGNAKEQKQRMNEPKENQNE